MKFNLKSKRLTEHWFLNLFQIHIKQLGFQNAWQQKIEIDGKQLYFDNDHAVEIMERYKA